MECAAVDVTVAGGWTSVSELESTGVRVPGVGGRDVDREGSVLNGKGPRRDFRLGDGGSGVGGRL